MPWNAVVPMMPARQPGEETAPARLRTDRGPTVGSVDERERHSTRHEGAFDSRSHVLVGDRKRINESLKSVSSGEPGSQGCRGARRQRAGSGR